MEFVFEVVLLSDSSHYLALREAGVVAIKVAEGYEDVPLSMVDVLIDRLALVFLDLVFEWGTLMVTKRDLQPLKSRTSLIDSLVDGYEVHLPAK